jgi:hypothetical protein
MRARRYAWIAVGLGVLASAACAKDPTIIDITVTAEGALPSITNLTVTLDPSGQALTGQFRSIYIDPDATITPFAFPTVLRFMVPGSPTSAHVDVIVEATDPTTSADVVARGTGQADILNGHSTVTSVMLVAVPPTAGDGGLPDGAGSDAAAADGTSDSAPDS